MAVPPGGTIAAIAAALVLVAIVLVVLSEGKVLGRPLLRITYSALAPLLAGHDPARRWQDVCTLLDLESAESLLDIGCGGGGLLACALSVAEGLRVTGIDWSAAVVAGVRRRLAPHGRFHMVIADVVRGLPFADGAFDRVACFGVLPGLRTWRLVLAEINRVLVPGGRLVLGGGNVLLWPLPDAQLLEAAAMLGFEMQRHVSLPHHGEVWHFEKM